MSVYHEELRRKLRTLRELSGTDSVFTNPDGHRTRFLTRKIINDCRGYLRNLPRPYLTILKLRAEAVAAEAIIEKLANQEYFKKEPQPLKNRSRYAMKLYTMYGDEKDGSRRL